MEAETGRTSYTVLARINGPGGEEAWVAVGTLTGRTRAEALDGWEAPEGLPDKVRVRLVAKSSWDQPVYGPKTGWGPADD